MKTLLVAPYSGMAEVAKNLPLPEDMSMDVIVANLEESIKAAKNAEANGYDMIISRGGTATLIQEAVSIPVIHIGITGYDMLRIFTLIRGIKQGVALVGYRNITEGAATICNILEYDIHRTTIHNREEVKSCLEKLKKEGFTVIIGDVITVQVAEMVGLRGILITSGKEALADSIEASRNMYRQLKKITRQNNLLHDTFHALPLPVVLVRKDGEIIEENDSFRRSLQNFRIAGHSPLKLAVQSVAKEGKNRWCRIERNGFPYDVQLFSAGKNGEAVGLLFQKGERQSNGAVFIEGNVAHRPVLGESDYAAKLRNAIRKYASSAEPVWIAGERGTGKRAVANTLHFERSGPETPVILIDGKAAEMKDIEGLKPALNAGSRRKTIIIDNPGKLTPDLQAKLYSLLVTFADAVYPITLSEKPVNTFAAGSFNIGLYELLSKNPLHLAPLRERKEDIRTYIDYFLAQLHAESGSNILGIRQDALDYLQSYPWPGNIGQLKKTIKELSLNAPGNFIELDQAKELLSKFADSEGSHPRLEGTLQEMEEQIIRQVLAEEGNNQSKAAARLGINRSTLWRKLKM